MVHNPDYTIPGTDIHLMFRTMFFEWCSDKLECELEDLPQNIEKLFKMKCIPDLLLASHKNYLDYNRLPMTADRVDAYMWMDAMGGPLKGVAAFSEMIKVMTACYMRINPDQVQTEVVQVEEEEKKS